MLRRKAGSYGHRTYVVRGVAGARKCSGDGAGGVVAVHHGSRERVASDWPGLASGCEQDEERVAEELREALLVRLVRETLGA